VLGVLLWVFLRRISLSKKRFSQHLFTCKTFPRKLLFRFSAEVQRSFCRGAYLQDREFRRQKQAANRTNIL
jgi:hypothetical protein